jgi:mono/diheme cytochrome c family protein
MRLRGLAVAMTALAFLPGTGAAEAPSFSREIAPIVQAKCAGCHNAEKVKGGYRADTFGGLLQPGDSEEAPIIAGNPEASELFRRLVTDDEDERMPQNEDRLDAREIELFRAWIAAGARLDKGDENSPLADLLPKAPHPAPPEVYSRPLPILALAFTADGQQLAAAGHHEVTFWNLDGTLARRLTNAPQRIRAIALSPDGRDMVLAGGQPGRYGEVSVYDFASGRISTNLLRTADEVLCAAFSADGKRFACAGTDNAIHLFDWEKRSRALVIQQHADWVTAIRFDRAGERLASASRDRTARVYSTATGELEVTYTTQNTPLLAAAFLPGDRVISGGRGKSLHLWDIKEGKKRGEIGGFNADVLALVVTAERIWSGGADGVLKAHAVEDRKELRVLKATGEAIFSLARHEGKIAAGTYDGSVYVWNAETGSLETSFVAAPGWNISR